MSVITLSRLWRGVGRDGSAAAAYSPSSLVEIAISTISDDLERDVGQKSRSRWSSDGTSITLGPEVRHGAYLDGASFGKQHCCLFRKASTAASFGKQTVVSVTDRWREGRRGAPNSQCGAVGLKPASHGLATRVRASARKGGRQIASPERLAVARRPHEGPTAGGQR